MSTKTLETMNIAERHAVALNPQTPRQVLDALSRTNTPSILLRVAEHPHSTISTLNGVAHSDPGDEVKLAIAQNPNTHAITLKALYYSGADSETLDAIAKHPNVDRYTQGRIIHREAIEEREKSA